MERSASVDTALSDLVRDHSSVVVLVTDRGGTIGETSRYATELMGPGLRGSRFVDWMVDFESSFDLERAVASEDPMSLSVTTSRELPRTLRFHFRDCGEKLLIVGEPLHEENEALHESLFALNAEISNLNRNLHKKTAELERLNEVKNRFIGIAAHDLRNPIGGIHEMAAVLHEEAVGQGNESHAEVFSAVRESTGFMLELIEDMLTAITIDSGEMRLNLELTDVNELISSTLLLNRLLADKKGVRLDLQQEIVPDVMVDRLKLRQVLNNLISNAVKFSHSDSAVVTSVARGHSEISISVTDTGPGIPSEEFHKLFKPFSQTTVTAPDGERSSGLGLSIVKRIVDAHGGTIRVESEVGSGTTFHVELPLPAKPVSESKR